MDLLSQLLVSLRFERLNLAEMNFGAPWGFNTQGYNNGFSLIVLSGECWIGIHAGERLRVGPGQSILVPFGGTVELASDFQGSTVDFETLWGEGTLMPLSKRPPAKVSRKFWGDPKGEKCRILGMTFDLISATGNDFHNKLPKLMLLQARSEDTAKITDLLASYLVQSDGEQTPGDFAQKTRLAEAILFSQIRQFVFSQANDVGFTAGLLDPRIAAALAAIHNHYAEPWTVASLASQASMSRAVFARRFHELVGQPPLEYLNRWRINLACQRLQGEKVGLGLLAAELGFGSELSFRRNFKKHMDCTPRVWRSKHV
jgi:AraC-like DNA-binding protein